MPRPSRVLAMSGGLAAAVVLISGTAAYAASRAQPADETYVACVNNTTGAMRLIDPLAGQMCVGDPGPGQERQIAWSKSGARGPEGPAGPRGPRGESGDDGDDGDGRLGRLEDLDGARCGSGADAGRVEITIGAPENGSLIQLICMTEDTVTLTPTPPPPTPTHPPTTAPAPTQYPDRPSEEPDPDGPPAPGTGGGTGGGDGPAGGGSPGGGDPGGGGSAGGGADSGAQEPEPSSIPNPDERSEGDPAPPV